MNIVSFLKLVEIQTKVASQIPFFLGTFYAIYRFGRFNALNFALMFLSLISFDMMTTALNNYIDYKKAVRTYGYGYESHNAIVRYKLKESSVIAVIAMLLIIAVAAGVALFANTGLVVLVLGAISFGIGVLYSFGPVPISRTPLGELFSGVTMGLIIPLLSSYIHVTDLSILDITIIGSRISIDMNFIELLFIVLISIPSIAGIANIMLANNVCDIEDDLENRRYTLPIYIGKEASLKLFAVNYYIGFAAIALAVVLRVVPILSAITLLTYIPVRKHIKMFAKVQTKKDTFVFAVKNFVIMNAVSAVSIGLGVLINML